MDSASILQQHGMYNRAGCCNYRQSLTCHRTGSCLWCCVDL